MKLLHTTDLHFNKDWFNWIFKQQNKFDIFCITGDFLESSKDETLQEQILWVSNWMKDFQKPLFVCSGNHDIEDFENEDWLNGIANIYSDNSITTINSIKFGCIEYIAPDFSEFDECDVILNHLPPTNTKTAIHKNTKDDWGDSELYRNIKNGVLSPKILLCGHMHHPAKTIDNIKNTTIYNPGVVQKNNIPNHIVIDIKKQT